jgi:hypothetical protein
VISFVDQYDLLDTLPQWSVVAKDLINLCSLSAPVSVARLHKAEPA